MSGEEIPPGLPRLLKRSPIEVHLMISIAPDQMSELRVIIEEQVQIQLDRLFGRPPVAPISER